MIIKTIKFRLFHWFLKDCFSFKGDFSICKSSLFSVLFLCLSVSVSFSQPDAYNHPELDWQTISGEHFDVHFHQGAERTARVVLKIAEEIYEPITSLYDYKLDEKMNFVIRDHDDYSNGGAFYFDNTVEIWGSNLDYDLRGAHNWLRDVVTHEFVHMIQLQATRKTSRRFPAFYAQVLAYEKEKRPDVIRGYPNVIASYPLPMVIVPLWFAEGVAQHQEKNHHYDIYDSHRDMLIRTRYLNNKLLTYPEMGSFGQAGTGNESVYNQGYSLVNFIVKNYGEEALRRISKNMASPFNFSFDRAIEKAIGTSGEKVYETWRKELEENYSKRLSVIQKNQVSGEKILLGETSEEAEKTSVSHSFYCSVCAGKTNKNLGLDKFSRSRDFQNFSDTVPGGGTANLYPTWSADGKTLAFVSNFEGGGYFGRTSLYTYETETKKHKLIKNGIYSTPSWSGKKIFYSRKGELNEFKSRFSDIYVFDLETEKETRLTHDLRAFNPTVFESKIAFAVNSDGTMNLVLAELDSTSVKNLRYLTNFSNGEQVYYPKFSPDGKQIVFDVSSFDGRDVALLNTDGTNFHYVANSKLDERNPNFSADGTKIIYSCDKTGIFNIYSYEFSSGKTEILTNVTGGAFMPSQNKDGKIAYAEFAVDGYKIAILDKPKNLDENLAVYIENYESTIPTRTFNDTVYPETVSSNYKPKLSKMLIFPRVTIDYGTVKPGVYGTWNDILNKYNFFWGFSGNKDFEVDAFSIIEYKFKKPTIFFELYYISRKLRDTSFGKATEGNDAINNETSAKRDFKYIFNLFEIDTGIRGKINSANDYQFAFVHSRYSTKVKYNYFVIDNVEGTVEYKPDDSLVRYFTPSPYFLGYSFSSKWNYKSVVPAPDGNINPHQGRTLDIAFDNEINQFNRDSDFSVSDKGTLQQNRLNYTMSKVKVDYSEFLPVPFLKKWRHTLAINFQGGMLLGYNKNNIAPKDSISAFPEIYTKNTRTPDDYFNFFGGGYPGMRGYSYYGLEGRYLTLFNFTYRFPIIKDRAFDFLHLRFDKLYGSVFADFGNLWENTSTQNSFRSISNGKSNLNKKESYSGYDYGNLKDTWKDYKIDVGYQLRASLFSFFGYPTAVEFSAAYGLTTFDTLVDTDPVSGVEKDRVFFPEGAKPLNSSDEGKSYVDKIVKNGGEWRYYLTVLFEF
ncbi:PD40 domain-containing protein [bacterium]|nr:PD40 domain-containing protein [bacterium]